MLTSSTCRLIVATAFGLGTLTFGGGSLAQTAKQDKQPKSSGKSAPQSPADGAPRQPKQTGDQKRLLRIKEQLKASDDEWAVLLPRVEQVIRLQDECNAGHDTKGVREQKSSKRPKDVDAASPAPDTTPDVKAQSKQLNATLLDPSAPPGDIHAKLLAVREARAKAKRSLVQAQEDLRALLTFRQEAVLAIMGLLD